MPRGKKGYKSKPKAKPKSKTAPKKGKARPMKSLSTGYRGTPNEYRFVRETIPEIVNVGIINPGVTIIPAAGPGDWNMSALQFSGFKMEQVSQFVTEFSPLFASYYLDKIETILIPQWQTSVQSAVSVGAPTSPTPELMVTRVNTKYFPGDFTYQATALLQRTKLAQIQKKSRSLYGSRKWLTVNTYKPMISKFVPEDNTGAAPTKAALQRPPWLSVRNASDITFAMNDVVFFDSMRGENLQPLPYLYRMYHRVHFRVSQVG